MTQIDIINNANERFNLFPRGFDSFNRTAAIIAQEFTIIMDRRSWECDQKHSQSALKAINDSGLGLYFIPSRWALEYEEHAKSQDVKGVGYKHLTDWFYNRLTQKP